MASLLMERLQFVNGQSPVADHADGGVQSDVIDMGPFRRILFLVHRGDATGGTAAPTYTVLACDDTTPSNTSAVAFNYRKNGAAVAAATTAGVQAGAGDDQVDVIEVREDALAGDGYQYVQLNIAETVNDPQVGGIVVIGELKDAAASAYATVTD